MCKQDQPRVLIVDDTPENLQILMEALKEEYHILATKSGEKSLDMAQGRPQPDVILLDILMPGMDGYEVCRRLKANDRTKDIPVIFITALTDADEEAKGLELGAIDYITKPFNPSLVKARVRNQVQIRQAAMHREDVERIMRHDLKAPLNGIIGLPLMIALDDNITPEQKEMLQMIEMSGKKMLEMIEMSLDLFKIELGQYVYHPKPVDALAVMKRLELEFRSRRAQKKCGWVVRVNEKLPEPKDCFPISSVESLFSSMVANLAINAIEASPSGQAITIDLKGPNPTEVSIHNQGAVPIEMRHCFFSKYHTCGKKGGTGLGTYSARMIAHALEGTIAMETDEVMGTTVRIQFA